MGQSWARPITAERKRNGWISRGANWASFALEFQYDCCSIAIHARRSDMLSLKELKKYTLISFATILLAACASQREPAQQMINDIQAAISAASADAAKYAPDQLNDVQTKFDDLKTAMNAQDYKGVLARG